MRFRSAFRRSNQGVGTGHAQRLEVLEISCKQQQIGVLGQRCNGYIGKAGVTALRHGGIRYLPCHSGGRRIQRQDAIAIDVQQTIEPTVQSVGPLCTACATQFADAL